MRPELIVAMDVPSSRSIPQIIDTLPNEITYYKIGLELFISEGLHALEYLKKKNKNIFLDLKLHDIPRTVARATAAAVRHGVDMLTVHAAGGRDMLEAAAEVIKEQGESALKLIAVTTLTSLDDVDLHEVGITRPLAEHTMALGILAISAGLDGLVCSPHEASDFRKKLGNDPILVTPGIRPAGSEADDQKRIATPKMAIKAGSNFLVVGRPILQASDPRAAAQEILRQMKNLE